MNGGFEFFLEVAYAVGGWLVRFGGLGVRRILKLRVGNSGSVGR